MLTRTFSDLDIDRLKQNDPYYWHQRWEVLPGVFTPGRSSVEELLRHAGVSADLTGLRVADIGAWNGCLSFECERRGAREVVAVSLEDPELTGFNFLKGALGAQVTRYERGSIYDLDSVRFGTFDIVICFGVIYHLRYPVLGIDNLRRIAGKDLYLESHVLDEALLDLTEGKGAESLSSIDPRLNGSALLQFYKGDELSGDVSCWFSASLSALVGLLETAGFSIKQTFKHDRRGYVHGIVRPGLPPFMDKVDGKDTYEGLFYDLSFERLFGPRERWIR